MIETLPEIMEERPLTVAEESRLTELEGIIEQNFKGFVAVGNALAEINESKLYRRRFRTFEEYCASQWEVNKSRAYQLIEASAVVKNVQNFGQNLPLPSNDSQARELARVPADEQAALWAQIVRDAEQAGAKITAKMIKKTVNTEFGNRIDSEIDRQRQDREKIRNNNTENISDEFTNAHDNFLNALLEEKKAGWRFTSRTVAHRYIAGLMDVVAGAVPGTMTEYGCAMELSDREKLLKAGFRIFSMDTKQLTIDELTAGGSWVTVMECGSPTQLNVEFKLLLDNPLHVKG